MAAVEQWVHEPQRGVARAWAGPLDPATLEGQSGREVAAAIAAVDPGPDTSAIVYRRAMRANEMAGNELEIAAADPPFERALVHLARRLKDLPA